MLDRRELVKKLAAGAAVVVGAGVARTSTASVRTDVLPDAGKDQTQVVATTVVDAATPETATAVAPWELLKPLRQDSVVGSGWSVAELTGAVDGTCVLTLRNEKGHQQRVHICRNEGTPRGPVHTKHFDMLVMNGGDGDRLTEEGLAQAMASVARVVSANEHGQYQLVSSLMAHDERVKQFSGADDRRLR